MTKEYQPIYVMGEKEPIAIVSKNDETGKTETTTGLCSIFSGSDIVMFIDDILPPLISCSISMNNMKCIFTLSDEIEKFLHYEDKWYPYYFIALNEQGHKAMIKGECKAVDFEINSSIDELSTEVTIYFNNRLDTIKGWLMSKNRDKINEEITILYRDLMEKMRKAHYE